jgi:hypothetical protein
VRQSVVTALSLVILGQATASLPPARAAGVPTAILSEDGKTLSYTPCSEDEAAECITYALDCRSDAGYGDSLRITIMGNIEEGPDVRAIAKRLLDSDFGEMTVRFTFAAGEPLDLMLTAFSVSQNEMDGDWILDLHSYQQHLLLEAIDADSARSVTLEVADHSMVLSDQALASERLLGFRNACKN